MTVRVATVLSAQEWEPRLVSHARETAELRMVLRAFQPDEIEERCDDIDIVVAGAEVAWVTPAQIAAWRRMGLNVVGVHGRSVEPSGYTSYHDPVDLTDRSRLTSSIHSGGAPTRT